MCDLPGIDRYKLASDPELGEPVTEMPNKPYLITVADRCGVFREETYETFDEALAAYGELRADYTTCVVTITNMDRAEHAGEVWFDGLSDEEREQL